MRFLSLNYSIKTWICGGDDFKVHSVPSNSLTHLIVKDLIHENAKRCHKELMRSIFTQKDVARVLQVPLLMNEVDDKRIWAFNNSVLYTVKSAYRVFCEKLANKDHLKVQGDSLS